MQLLVTIALVLLCIGAAVHCVKSLMKSDWLGAAVAATAIILLWQQSAWPL